MVQPEFFFLSVATLGIGTLINQLMFRYRRLNCAAVLRHRETLSLFELTRDLVSVSEPLEMVSLINQQLSSFLYVESVLYFRGDRIGYAAYPFDANERMAAHWAQEHLEPAGRETDTLPSAQGLWIPLSVSDKKLGALGIYCKSEGKLRPYQYLFEAFAHVLALSLDRS